MKPRDATTHDFSQVPPAFPVRRSGRDRLYWSAVVAIVVAGLMLRYFNPTEHWFYPTCMFHTLTGLNCPGCGSLRALHHLTHGEVAVAFHCNPLLVLGLPLVLLAVARRSIQRRNQPPPAALFARTAVIWTLLAVIAVFGVLRNLPFPAFAWMSP